MRDSREELRELRRSRLGQDYPSRKNKVFKSELEGELVVVKIFPVDRYEAASAEFTILERCSKAGLAVPSPIRLLQGAIVIEHIEGTTVADALDSIDAEIGLGAPDGMERAGPIMRSLGCWLASFHELHGFRVARGDSIMRNFILVDHALYGIDFEEASECDVLLDLGQMCSSLLSMRPMFTKEKFELVHILSNHYFEAAGTSRLDDLPGKISEALRFYARFRRDGGSLLTWADRIEHSGLAPHQG
jgi:tRNA A-37 threonylcarbamoyl transferase component Bud32